MRLCGAGISQTSQHRILQIYQPEKHIKIFRIIVHIFLEYIYCCKFQRKYYRIIHKSCRNSCLLLHCNPTSDAQCPLRSGANVPGVFFLLFTHTDNILARSAPTCIRIPPYPSRTAPIHQYTPRRSSRPTYHRKLLRMNVIAFETC